MVGIPETIAINPITISKITPGLFARKGQTAGILELLCQALELSDAQFRIAKDRYESVGKWLAGSDNWMLSSSSIYPQGSISLGTIVRPIKYDEFDVDLVCNIPAGLNANSPQGIKNLIGERLRQHSAYAKILEEKTRCWRLNYANEFHLDITPSIPNPTSVNRGELVPDKKLKEWKATNPKGYRAWFDARAKLAPKLYLDEAMFVENKAEIESLPQPTKFKGILSRCVQLCKRHRDIWFKDKEDGLAPISIIITTILAKSYECCVKNYIYDTEIDVLVDAIRNMPKFIERDAYNGNYYVWNETTHGENFAEKWNSDNRLPLAFFAWHDAALKYFIRMADGEGLDNLYRNMSVAFGVSVANNAIQSYVSPLSSARESNSLSVSKSVGLVVGSKAAVPVRKNTFFGS